MPKQHALRGICTAHRLWQPVTLRHAERTPAWPLLLLSMVLALSGCATTPAPSSQDVRVEQPYTGCKDVTPTVAQGHFALSAFSPLPPDVLEHKLRAEPFKILKAHHATHGSSSAAKLTIQFQDCTVLNVKWRAFPHGGDAYNNSPREFAAYALQKLFLAPKDWVVPVTVAACVPRARLATFAPDLQPQLAGTTCVMGELALWLHNVKTVDHLLDKPRFAQSASRHVEDDYAWYFANFNIFTRLISHRDGRKANFLVSAVPQSAHIFSIDNGESFSGLGNPRPFITHWGHLKVDQLPRATVARLRTMTAEQLQQALATVAEFRQAQDGTLQPVVAVSPPLDPTAAVRHEGGVFQLGMKQEEITKVGERLQKLLQRVDTQKITLF